MNGHRIKWITLDITVRTFFCYPCFVIMDRETKEIKIYLDRYNIYYFDNTCTYSIIIRVGVIVIGNRNRL